MTDQLRHGAEIHIGHARDTQDDSMLAKPPLFVVADGMGGHRGGDVASQMAVEMLGEDILTDGDALTASIQRANRAIYEAGEADRNLDGMGTTVVAMIAQEDSAQIAHVGDSRAYLLRDGKLRRLTQDHSYVNSLVREGKLSEQEAEFHPQRSVLERALGQESEVEIEMQLIDTKPGDRVLLCTDGLTTHISDPEIEDLLSSAGQPTEVSKRLVTEALDAGGNDNITVIVVDFPGGPDDKRARKSRSPRRTLVTTGIVLALLLVLALAGRAAVNNNYFVGQQQENVAIFRGVPGSFAGISLQTLETRTEVPVESLPDIYHGRLAEGIRAASLEEAERIVQHLREQSSVERAVDPPEPSNLITPSPGPATP